MSDTETAGKTGRSRRLSLAIAVLVGIVIGAGGYAAVSAIVGGGSISVACARVAELEQATAGGPHLFNDGSSSLVGMNQQIAMQYQKDLAELKSARQACSG